MYIPSHFRIEEIKAAYDIIKEYSFATLTNTYMGILHVRILNGRILAIKLS